MPIEKGRIEGGTSGGRKNFGIQPGLRDLPRKADIWYLSTGNQSQGRNRLE